jgi:hypothetical protein
MERVVRALLVKYAGRDVVPGRVIVYVGAGRSVCLAMFPMACAGRTKARRRPKR